MSDDLATYHRVLGHFTDLVDSLSDDQWAASTPCEGWTVRDLMEHIVVRDRRIAASLGGPEVVEPGPSDDLATAWHAQLDWWAAGLADPTRASATWSTVMGELTFQQATLAMMTGEIAIHTWDLARSIGADETLDPEAVHHSLTQMQAYGDMLRQPGAMGPELPAPAGADEQTQLLAFTGRQV